MYGEMPWPKTGATHFHTQLGLSYKYCAIKGLVVFNGWDLEPLDELNDIALGCYQPSPKSTSFECHAVFGHGIK